MEVNLTSRCVMTWAHWSDSSKPMPPEPDEAEIQHQACYGPKQGAGNAMSEENLHEEQRVRLPHTDTHTDH